MTNETQAVVDLIADQWDASKTSNKKPTVAKIIDHKKASIADNDWVLVYFVSDNPQVRGEHGHDYWVKENIQAIDIRSSVSHNHLIDLRDEAKRTIYVKRKNAEIDGYDRLDIIGGPGDLSDKMRGLFRWVLHVKMTGYYKQIVT